MAQVPQVLTIATDLVRKYSSHRDKGYCISPNFLGQVLSANDRGRWTRFGHLMHWPIDPPFERFSLFEVETARISEPGSSLIIRRTLADIGWRYDSFDELDGAVILVDRNSLQAFGEFFGDKLKIRHQYYGGTLYI